MELLPPRNTWGTLSSEKTKEALVLAQKEASTNVPGQSADEKIRLQAEADELWLRNFMLQQEKESGEPSVPIAPTSPASVGSITAAPKVGKVAPESLLAHEKKEGISGFQSFTTERNSVYNVLEDGKVQRIKKALLDPSYNGADKGSAPERTPSDVMLFYDPSMPKAEWFEDIGATDAATGKTIAKVIDIGTYVQEPDGTFRIVKNNNDLKPPFIFVRVLRDDSFKLKDTFTFDELKEFEKRTLLPENPGLGIIVSSANGEVTNVPKIGYCPFDYRHVPDGRVQSMHNGNKIVSIIEK